MTFTEWLKSQGQSRVARMTGVSLRVVSLWALGHNPSVRHMRKLRQVSGGFLTYEIMLDRIPGRVK